MVEVYDLAPGHRVKIATGPDGETRYTCSCGQLVDGNVEAAHFHSDRVTP